MIRLLVNRIGFYLAASTIFMLLMVVMFSVFYHFTEGLGWLDSFYFTVITTRTVGFGDIHPTTPLGKVGTILNALLPATVFLGASLVVLQTMMKTLEQSWRKFLMSRLHHHDILIGTADLLSGMLKEYDATRRRYLVIDRQPYDQLPIQLQQMLGSDRYLEGDASNDDILRQAGIERARSVIIASPDDSYNLYVLVTARSMSSTIKTIVRINDLDNTSKFLSVGADTVLPAATVMGQMLAQASFNPHAHDFMVALHTHTHEPFFEDFRADEGTVGKSVFEAYTRPVAIFRNGAFLYDMHGQIIQHGDVVVCIGLRE